jgi:hypothetical protein
MHFLPTVYVTCEVCNSKRFTKETLEIKFRKKNIHEVLELTIEEAIEFFKDIPAVEDRLQSMMDVGLGYVKLGQSATTLSGGEAQRVKISSELYRAHLTTFKEVNPFGYTVRADGTLADTAKLSQEPWLSLQKAAQAKKIRYIPTLMWSDGEAIHKILSNDTSRRALAQRIADLVKEKGYDGFFSLLIFYFFLSVIYFY